MSSVPTSPAGPQDRDGLSNLHQQLFPPGWSAAEVGALLDAPGAHAFVTRDPRLCRIEGFIIGRRAADEAEILSLGVSVSSRRQGHAQALVRALAAAVATEGAVQLYLEVGSRNGGAVALYQRLGFIQRGLRRGYYREAGTSADDAFILALDLRVVRSVEPAPVRRE